MTAGTWPCEAYGPDAIQYGALCFRAEPWQRVCPAAADCATFMERERQRVFQRLQLLAALDDPAAVELAQHFTNPSQILGGPDDVDEDLADEVDVRVEVVDVDDEERPR